MRRWLSLLRYFGEDALDEWRHSPGSAFLATATVGAVLFVGALALLVGSNVRTSLQAWSREAKVSRMIRSLFTRPTNARAAATCLA